MQFRADSAETNVNIILYGLLNCTRFCIPKDSREGECGMDNGKRYFGTLEGIQALIDHDRLVAQLCRHNDQNGKHYKYANIWRNALNHIFTQSRTTKKHFDTMLVSRLIWRVAVH